eukprot:TRINITY_DN960_c0_g1_i2.p1 TRINITY_DN960_c0_g1~~TRINITY_DN960_c0_g1_i2.p1  ORF type:complete len:286 (-),score=67.39 TRINITY_DN960_c0_g1_i2:139-996(-)
MIKYNSRLFDLSLMLSYSTCRYIMTHYYLGFLVGQVMKPDRLRQVEQSKIHYMSFLKYCEYLDLLQKQDKDALLDDSKKDAATLRAEKLGRYQREKAANAKMEVILKREEEALKAAGGDPEMIENIGLEEEVVREFVLASIDMGVSKTIGELKMIEQEFEVLKMMAARPLPPSSQPPRGPQPSDKPITVQHIPKQGPPQVVNLSDRIKLQQQVFQPGHRLPTMTVDEYVHEEIQKRGILTGKGDEKKEEDEDSEDEEVSDRKTYKARSWDDWKDHNPRGAGNLKR